MERQVKAFLDNLATQLTYSPSTCMAYENDLRCFTGYLRETLGRPPVPADFNAEQVAGFLKAERLAGRRHSTLLRRRASLRRFAKFLQPDFPDLVSRFEASAWRIDQAMETGSPAQRPHYLTEEQVERLWTAIEASPRPRARRDQAILGLLLESGLTVGTLIALNLADIDLENGRLHLCTDTGKDVWLPLVEAFPPLLRYIKEGRPELNYTPGEQALFISQTGGRMSRQGVWQVLRQWGNKANLQITLSPRLARHTAAHRLARSGRSLDEIQILLGHSNPLSTQALLRRLAESEKQEQE
jgi:integrase/recombinase XerD